MKGTNSGGKFLAFFRASTFFFLAVSKHRFDKSLLVTIQSMGMIIAERETFLRGKVSQQYFKVFSRLIYPRPASSEPLFASSPHKWSLSFSFSERTNEHRDDLGDSGENGGKKAGRRNISERASGPVLIPLSRASLGFQRKTQREKGKRLCRVMAAASRSAPRDRVYASTHTHTARIPLDQTLARLVA